MHESSQWRRSTRLNLPPELVLVLVLLAVKWIAQSDGLRCRLQICQIELYASC